MPRYFLTNRWILAGVAFLLLFSFACYLWYQRDTSPYKQEAAETAELVREWEIERSNTGNPAETVSSQAPADRTPLTAEKSTSTQTHYTTAEKSATHSKVPIDTLSVEDVKTARMSPYGFGPYPTIPDGAPIADFEEGDSRDMELLTRVMVQKWNEGERFTGGIIENGKVYLTYKNILYVEYDEEINPITGKITRYISSTMGGGLPITSEEIASGNIPSGVEIVNMDSVGYDPYDVLDLP